MLSPSSNPLLIFFPSKKIERHIYPKAFLWRIQTESSKKKKKKERVGGEKGESETSWRRENLTRQETGAAQARDVLLAAQAPAASSASRGEGPHICSTPSSPTRKDEGPAQTPDGVSHAVLHPMGPSLTAVSQTWVLTPICLVSF